MQDDELLHHISSIITKADEELNVPVKKSFKHTFKGANDLNSLLEQVAQQEEEYI